MTSTLVMWRSIRILHVGLTKTLAYALGASTTRPIKLRRTKLSEQRIEMLDQEDLQAPFNYGDVTFDVSTSCWTNDHVQICASAQ